MPRPDRREIAASGSWRLSSNSNVVPVALGAIWRMFGEQASILITRRPRDSHLGGYWELPGGRIEADETPMAALQREIHEELDVIVDNLSLEPLCDVVFDYPERTVNLKAFLVSCPLLIFPGSQCRLKHRWVRVDRLSEVNFPPANRSITEAIQRHFAR